MAIWFFFFWFFVPTLGTSEHYFNFWPCTKFCVLYTLLYSVFHHKSSSWSSRGDWMEMKTITFFPRYHKSISPSYPKARLIARHIHCAMENIDSVFIKRLSWIDGDVGRKLRVRVSVCVCRPAQSNHPLILIMIMRNVECSRIIFSLLLYVG